MTSGHIDFHVYYSTQPKESVCPFRSVLVVQLPGKHLQTNMFLKKDYVHADFFFLPPAPLETQHFSQNIKGSGKGFPLMADRSQLVHGLL